MSDKAIANTNVEILLYNIKSNMTGSLNYDITTALAASSGEGWIYAEKDVTTTSADLLGTTEDYLGSVTGATALQTADKINWIAIKHTGTVNGTVPTNNGVMLCTDGGTSAFDLADGIYLSPNELIVLKIPNTTVANFHCVAVSENGSGLPTATGTTNVRVLIAAILTNVA